MNDKDRLLKEYVKCIVESDDLDANVTQELTIQQYEYRLNNGCPVCGGELIKRPRIHQTDDDLRKFAGNFHVCERNPDTKHYNLSIPHGRTGVRERYRGAKPETRDSITSLVKPNDGKNRVIRGRLPTKKYDR